MAIATLTIDMVAKLANLERDMGKATHIAERNAQRMEKAFAGVAKTLATLGASLSVGAFVGLVRGLADSGDALAKLSTRTGDTVEELSKLQYAASLADTSNETLEKSLTKLNRVMGDAANGVKEAKDALDRFGIEPGSKLTTIEAFQQIADRVKATGDQTKIASALNDVFGRSFAELIPLLKGGSDELKSAGDELERMGGVMSGELARASEQFNDNITRLSKKMEALKIEIVGPLIPLFLEISNVMAQTGEKSDQLSHSGQILKTVFETIAVIGANVAYVFKAMGNEIGGVAAQINALAHLDFKAFSNIGASMREDAAKARKDIDALTDRLLNPAPAAASSQKSTGPGILNAVPVIKLPKIPKAPKAPKEKAYTDLLTPAAEAYAAVLKSIDSAQLAAEKSTLKLSNSQSALYDLISSPLWDQFPQAWKDVAIAQAEAGTAAEKAAEDYNHLKDLIDATPTAKLEETRNEMLFLADAFLSGKISADQFSEAAQTALGNLPKEAKEATDAMSEFAIQAARNMQDAFAEFLFDPFKGGVGDMLKNFGTAIQKMIAQAVSADLFGRLFGKLGGGQGDGLLGGFFDFLGNLSPNAAGGVYTSPGLSAYSGQIVSRPTVFPFARGIGLMGEAGAEAILPLKRGSDGKLGVAAGGGGGGGGPTINVYVSGNNAPDVRRAAGQGAREALAAFNGAGRYG